MKTLILLLSLIISNVSYAQEEDDVLVDKSSLAYEEKTNEETQQEKSTEEEDTLTITVTDSSPIVKEEVVKTPDLIYFIQMGAFKDNANARRLVKNIKSYDYAVATSFLPLTHDTLTVVFIGPFKNRDDAEKHRKIMTKKMSLPSSFIIEAKP